MNTADVLDAWMSGKEGKEMRHSWNTYYRGDFYKTSHKVLHTDGESLWSHGMCIGITEKTASGLEQKVVLDRQVRSEKIRQHIVCARRVAHLQRGK